MGGSYHQDPNVRVHKTGCAVLPEFVVKHSLMSFILLISPPLDQMLHKCMHESHLFCSLICSVPSS